MLLLLAVLYEYKTRRQIGDAILTGYAVAESRTDKPKGAKEN